MSRVVVTLDALADGWRVADTGGDLEVTTFDNLPDAEDDVTSRRHYYMHLYEAEIEIVTNCSCAGTPPDPD
jgi:hypothetical protein